MSQRAKRHVAAWMIASIVLGAGAALFVAARSTRAAAQALPDVGPFRAGAALGEERSGFSGRPQVKVFASADAQDWPALAACIETPELSALMVNFTGILIDERLEPEVEAYDRAAGTKVIVRALDGSFLGGLQANFTCKDLVALLELIRAEFRGPPEKSPVYTRLLESTEPIAGLKAQGESPKATKLVEFLSEFEGSTAPAVTAARAELAK